MSNTNDYQNQLSLNDENDEIKLSTQNDEFEKIIDKNLAKEQDLLKQKLFLTFQNVATNVTKMFRSNNKILK